MSSGDDGDGVDETRERETVLTAGVLVDLYIPRHCAATSESRDGREMGA